MNLQTAKVDRVKLSSHGSVRPMFFAWYASAKFHHLSAIVLMLLVLTLLPVSAFATPTEINLLDLTSDWRGFLAVGLFALAYMLIAGESHLNLRKSVPMILAACLIWVLVAFAYRENGDSHTAEVVFRSAVETYIELFLFLLASMTYVNVLNERGLFLSLRHYIAVRKFSPRAIYWITGAVTFLLSAVIANLAVALLMATIVVTIAGDNQKFLIACCINIVVATNAGGAFSPFGDISTLMIWQDGAVAYFDFYRLFLPSVVNWLLPAIILSFTFSNAERAVPITSVVIQNGGWTVVVMFICTLLASVWFETALGLPAVIGMMTGLGALKLFGYSLKRQGVTHTSKKRSPDSEEGFDIFKPLENAEWDTLMFLFGIVCAISGLYALGYMLFISEFLYGNLTHTTANTVVGSLSALFENIAMMYAVIAMSPEMSQSQWLLVTLATSVGGSLLSIGSAAGIAVMGQARFVYTFATHLRWTWAIALGYGASIWVHLWLNP